MHPGLAFVDGKVRFWSRSTDNKTNLIAHEVPVPEGVFPTSPSSYVDLARISGVIHLRISIAEIITLLYIVQSYSLSI